MNQKRLRGAVLFSLAAILTLACQATAPLMEIVEQLQPTEFPIEIDIPTLEPLPTVELPDLDLPDLGPGTWGSPYTGLPELADLAAAVDMAGNGGAYLENLSDEQYDPEDFASPDTLTYTVTLLPGEVTLLTWYWCAVDATTLVENTAVQKLATQFTIDGQVIDPQYVQRIEYPGDGGQACLDLGVVARNWSVGSHTAETRVTFLQPVNDGYDEYPAGDYVAQFNIEVAAPQTGWPAFAPYYTVYNAPDIVPLAEDLAAESYTDEEYDTPGTLDFSFTIAPQDQVTFTTVWCAADWDTLDANLAQIEPFFTFNGQDFPEYATFYFEWDDDDQVCASLEGVLMDWPAGTHLVAVTAAFNGAVNNGFADYPAGDYTFNYTVTVGE